MEPIEIAIAALSVASGICLVVVTVAFLYHIFKG